MISTPQYDARRLQANGQVENEAPQLQMVSDWLNITPSKDFPLFSPALPIRDDDSNIGGQNLRIGLIGGAYTPPPRMHGEDDPAVFIVSQLQLHTKQPLPINGRTIYSLQGTGHVSTPQTTKCMLRANSFSNSSTTLYTPSQLTVQPESAFASTPPEYAVESSHEKIPFVPTVTETDEDEFLFCFPSFLRTRAEFEDDVTRPPSPTPLLKSRYDPASNPWALPKLPPPFAMKPRASQDVSPLSSLPSTRESTPDKKLPRKFKSSAIMLNRDWLNDRRAYECHRYGTRSRMSEKGLSEASLREVNWDLEKIRGGGISANEKLFVEPQSEPYVDSGKRKRVGETLPQNRSPKKTCKRENSQNTVSRKLPLGRVSRRKAAMAEKITTAKSEEVAVSLALEAKEPFEPSSSPSSFVNVPSSPVTEPEIDDDDDDYTENKRSAHRGRTSSRKSASTQAVDETDIRFPGDYQADVEETALHPKKIRENPTFTIDLENPGSIRSFPEGVTVNARFPLLYRRFPVCSFFDPTSQLGKAVYSKIEAPKRPQGIFNQPHTSAKSCWNLYQPRYVKGSGNRKEGLCPLCKESPERGGLGKNDWYEMKTSAFNYHLQKFHGISPTTGLPFSPPINFRLRQNNKAQRHQKKEFEEGLCHSCKSWIPLEGPNIGDSKVKELYWWKHACACHKGSMIEGESDFWYDDEVAQAIREHESRVEVLSSPSQSMAASFS